MNRKGISSVVTTVLLILISIASLSIVASKVLPMIDLSPQISCTEMQISPPASIQSAVIENGEVKLTLQRYFTGRDIKALEFRIDSSEGSSQFACTPACENCIIPGEGELAEYYFAFSPSEVPESIVLTIDGCTLQSYQLGQ